MKLKNEGRGGLPALFVISIPAAPPSNMRLLFKTGKLAVLMSTPVNRQANTSISEWQFHCPIYSSSLRC